MLLRPLSLHLLLLLLSMALSLASPLSLLRRRAAATDTAATATAAVQWPIELQNLTWTSEQGAILLNGRQFHLKGVNWFGMETETRCVPADAVLFVCVFWRGLP
jgi:hypothetical protein